MKQARAGSVVAAGLSAGLGTLAAIGGVWLVAMGILHRDNAILYGLVALVCGGALIGITKLVYPYVRQCTKCGFYFKRK